MVSIIIPYYNRPEKLQRAIASILAQTYQDFEIIVVDDASSMPPELPNIDNCFYVRNDINKGPGYSRNRGLEVAKGKYICFLDSDDYWHPDFLYTCLNAICFNQKVAFVYCNTMLVDNDKEVGLRRSKTVMEEAILPILIEKGRPWSTGACMWNREVINKMRGFVHARNWEDYAFEIEAATICNNVFPIEKPLVYCDMSGSDKLSVQHINIITLEKAKSVQYISEVLIASDFYEDLVVRNSFLKILINLLIDLLKVDIDAQLQIREIVRRCLLPWSSVGLYVLIRSVLCFSDSMALKCLRIIRRHLV